MNSTSLHALIIDQYFGELPPETAELLHHYLEVNVAARAEAERILQTLAITEKTVASHPELVARAITPLARTPGRPMITAWLIRAAAVTLIASAAFFAGRTSRDVSMPMLVRQSETPASAKKSPWARYRMAFDAKTSAIQIVRVDTKSQPPIQ